MYARTDLISLNEIVSAFPLIGIGGVNGTGGTEEQVIVRESVLGVVLCVTCGCAVPMIIAGIFMALFFRW